MAEMFYDSDADLSVIQGRNVAVIGYGVQGPAQGLNMRDNGFNVIVGQAPEFKRDWDRAVKDGWKPGVNLFPIAEACEKATVIQMLVSDAAQKAMEAHMSSAAGRLRESLAAENQEFGTRK